MAAKFLWWKLQPEHVMFPFICIFILFYFFITFFHCAFFSYVWALALQNTFGTVCGWILAIALLCNAIHSLYCDERVISSRLPFFQHEHCTYTFIYFRWSFCLFVGFFICFFAVLAFIYLVSIMFVENLCISLLREMTGLFTSYQQR